MLNKNFLLSYNKRYEIQAKFLEQQRQKQNVCAVWIKTGGAISSIYLLLTISALNPHLQLVMTCSNPLHTSCIWIVTSHGKYQGNKNSKNPSFSQKHSIKKFPRIIIIIGGQIMHEGMFRTYLQKNNWVFNLFLFLCGIEILSEGAIYACI